jgi:hypothetical protein
MSLLFDNEAGACRPILGGKLHANQFAGNKDAANRTRPKPAAIF